ADRRLHRRRPGAVRPDLLGQRVGPVHRGREGGEMTTTASTLDRPASPPAFQPVSGARKIKNMAATVLVTLAFLIALVPLVWLLVSVISRGYQAVLTSDWWTHSLKGVLPKDFEG